MKTKEGPRWIGHANLPGWWVYATARPTGNRSAMGPYLDPVEAARFVAEHRPHATWRNISITLRNGKRR